MNQTDDGLKAASPCLPDSGTCVSLFVRNSVNVLKMIPKSLPAYEELPYDLYCPSLQKVLQNRICKSCGIYFASHVMLSEHIQVHSKQVLKIVTQKNNRAVNQDKIWNEYDAADEERDQSGVPVICIDQHLQPLWH